MVLKLTKLKYETFERRPMTLKKLTNISNKFYVSKYPYLTIFSSWLLIEPVF